MGMVVEQQFPLREGCSQMFVADGRQVKTHGYGEITLRLGSQEVLLNVLVADIEDAGILGMDFLTTTNASIDITGRQMTLNGETFYFTDSNSQPLSFRCFTRRSVVIAPSTEVTIPVRAGKRQWKASSPELHHGMRILEPSTNCKLKSKGILVGSTLVDVSDNKPLLIRVVNHRLLVPRRWLHLLNQ